ncbi:hypothetical protein GINT2_000206 [Glugoides intestinalis]
MTKVGITIADFNEITFSPHKLVECLSEWDMKDIKKTLQEISEANYQLDLLKEAIFYKKEKIKNKITEQKEEMLSENHAKLCKMLCGIELQNLSNSAVILQKRKQLVEKKRLARVFKYSLSLEKSKEHILEGLLKSDDTADLMLLAELVSAHINFDFPETATFTNYSKKLEEKISTIFQRNMENNTIHICKLCFNIMETIDKECVLIDLFLLSKELLSTNLAVYPQQVATIDLAFPKMADSTFSILLKNVLKALEDNYLFICRVFGLEESYCEYMFSKIFKTLITMSLGSFMNVGNAAIYLICLQSAFYDINEFVGQAKMLFPKVNLENMLFEVVNQLIYKATGKEIQLFDEVLEICLSGAKTLNTYTLNGVKLTKTVKNDTIYENAAYLIDSFLKRSEELYLGENETEILRFYGKKLCIIVDKIIISSKTNFDKIEMLLRIHNINKRLLNDKFELFESFNTKLEEAIMQEFDSIVDEVKAFVKKEIESITFNDNEAHFKLLHYLRKLFEKSRPLGQRNIRILFYQAVETIYNQLYIHILFFGRGSEQQRSILKCVDDFSGYLAVNISLEFISRFERLKMISELVGATQNHFPELCNKYKALITEKELKDIQKSRKDT